MMLRRHAFFFCAVTAGVLAATAAGEPERWPAGHDYEGLPAGTGPIAVYAADAAHPLNRLHALLFFATRTPTEIGATLPAERRRAGSGDKEFYRGKWAFLNRRGAEIAADRDTRRFGGDVRTSPAELWTEGEAAEARAILATLATPEAAAKLVPGPLARLSLQWDLLQVWWRFERSGRTDDATLAAMARAIRALGQERAVFAALPSGIEALEAATRVASRDRREPRATRGLLGGADSPWVEMDRAPAALFSAQRSLVSARVFVKSTDRATVEALVAQVPLRAAAGKLVEVPRETETVLLLAMMGVTGGLEPVATPVASELRVRMAVAADVLDPAGDTSTRDGWNQWVWLFSREAALAGAGDGPLRFVRDTSQSLFLEYGSPKHTTYYAQCALCHRATNAGNQTPSGVNVLGLNSKPAVLADPTKRWRDAEAQMAPVIAKLRTRLAGAKD